MLVNAHYSNLLPYPLYGYLTFTPSAGTVSVTPSSYWNATTKQYSLDNGITWNNYTSGVITGSSVQFRGIGGTLVSSSSAEWDVVGSNISISGNLETILDYSDTIKRRHPQMSSYCCSHMFHGKTNIVSAENLILPVLLAEQCCDSMFYGCTSLTTPPQLPATILAQYCYLYMFYGCTSLTTAPILPVIDESRWPVWRTLREGCYFFMFYGCTSLTSIPSLPAITLFSRCYVGMLANCTSLKFSETQTQECSNAYRIPVTGTGTVAEDWNKNMLLGTSGTFTSDPQINTTYYTNATVV